jgi:hypothetical protein
MLKGQPLPPQVVNTIDPGIRDIVTEVNALPFVRRTLFSCAGYGPQGDQTRPGEHKPYLPDKERRPGRAGLCQGYIFLEYDPSNKDWQAFNAHISKFFDDVRDGRRGYWNQFKTGPLRSYDLLHVGTTCKRLLSKWQRVRQGLNAWKDAHKK